MYQVLARKWRPQTFEELVGQQHVARTLGNALTADRLAHAYIFAGLRGTGETTVARILAKCLNCEQGPTLTPCGECPACTEIAQSSSMDVMELDAASRTGVDNIRELQQVVSVAPVRDRFRVLILDEAHMLSKSAFNALLKTLEEPPPGVKFVLATTEMSRLPTTIVSRCQVFEFRRVAVGDVAKHLRRICDDESVKVSDAALERIARAGEGSVRDALSLLERALALCGTEIGDDDVLRMLGAVRAEVLVGMVQALAARDAGAMLAVLDSLVEEGHDLVHFWSELVSALRDLLMLHAAPDRTELLARSPDEGQALLAAADGLSREDLSRAFQIVADLEPGLKASSQPRYLFEATLIRLASLGAVRPIEDVLQSLGGAPVVAPARPAATPTQKKKPDAPRPVAAAEPPPRPAAAPPPEAPAAARPVEAPAPPAPAMPSMSGGGTQAFVAAVQDARPLLGAALENAGTVSIDAGRLLVRFPTGMAAIKKQLEQRDCLALLRQEAEKVAGGPVEVSIELTDDDPPPAKAAPAPPRPTAATAAAPRAEPAPDPPPAEPSPAPRSRPVGAAEQNSLLETARSEPGVQKLLDSFNAHVVEIHESDSTAGPEQG